MRIFTKMLVVPAMFVVAVMLVVSGMSLYRGWLDNDTGVMASAVAGFGLNGVLLVLGMRVLMRNGIRLKRSKPVLGTRSLRLKRVGTAPRIALF